MRLTITTLLILISTLKIFSNEKPNILFVLVDDLGWADVGYNGATYYLTPTLDKFSEKALIFNRSYTMPTCSPSRATLFTGLNAVHTDIYHVDAFWRTPKKLFKVQPVKSGHFYTKPITMLSEMLKAEGYTTGYAGKWHVNDDPTENGFDFNAGGWEKGGPKSYFSPYHNPKLKDGPDGEYLPFRLMEESKSFIKENKDKPFFLCYAPYLVHRPLQARAEDVAKFEKRAKEDARFDPTYAAMIETFDKVFKELLETLEAEGVADNTIIIVTSDNGVNKLSGRSDPLRGEKGSCYEGGVRVPTLMYWPGVTKAEETEALIDMADWYPTIASIVGTEAPSHTLDGIDQLPLITGKKKSIRENMFWHMPCYNGTPESPQIWQTPFSSICNNRYKLIYFYEDKHYELYDLLKDQGETTNIVDKKRKVASKMKKELTQWLDINNAKLPKPLK